MRTVKEVSNLTGISVRTIHFIISFQDSINAGNQAFHTFFFCCQHFPLHLQNLILVKSRVRHNRQAHRSGHRKTCREEKLFP